MKKRIVVPAVVVGLLVVAGSCSVATDDTAETEPSARPSVVETTEAPPATESAPAPAPAPTVTVTEPAPTVTAAPPADEGMSPQEQEFIQRVEGSWADAAYVPDEDLLETGWLVCAALDDGATVLDFLEGAVIDGGVDPYVVGVFLGAASTSLCPEHSDRVLSEVDDLSSYTEVN